MSLTLGEILPNFQQNSNLGVIDWHSFLGDEYGVLLTIDSSHSETSKNELVELVKLSSEFTKLRTKIAVLSIEPLESLEPWMKTILNVENLSDLPFLLIYDQDLKVCEQYSVRIKDSKVKNISILVISPEKTVLSFAEYPSFCQRNWKELLRVLTSFNITRGKKVATPVNWEPGEQLIVFPQMKILITGATGLLGRHLMKVLSDSEVYGWGFSRAAGRISKVDITNTEEILSELARIKPSIIIHCAAIRSPDLASADPERTDSINVKSTETLAKWAKENDSFLLYISTDYIFDGTNPPYKPNSKPNPLNFYGRSKLEGEKALWSTGHNGGVLRIPILYGMVEELKETVITELIEKVKSQEPVKLDNWAVRYPTFVGDAGYVIKQICMRRTKHCGFSGTWHWSGKEKFTKYEMALVIASILKLPTDHLIPVNEPPSTGEPRPQNPHLMSTALEHMGFGRHSPFKDTIETLVHRLT